MAQFFNRMVNEKKEDPRNEYERKKSTVGMSC